MVQLHPSQLQRLYEEACQPALRQWMEANPHRAAKLTAEEIDELLSLQGTGGPLTLSGVEQFVSVIERRRTILAKVATICGTEWIELTERFVDLVYRDIQPYHGKVG
jgi:hypothetical protein